MRLPSLHMLLAALAVCCFASATQAQTFSAEGTVKFNLLSIEGLTVGKTLKVDSAFGQKHGLDVPSPFSVLVPTSDDVRELVLYAPSGKGGPFFKLTFASQDENTIENLQFTGLRLGLGDPEERIRVLTRLLAENMFAQVVQGSQENSRDVVRKTMIGDYEAVEILGRYQDPEVGLIFTRIVGIPNPHRAEGVVAIANVVASQLAVPTPDDFPRTRGGTTLRHFKYLEE